MRTLMILVAASAALAATVAALLADVTPTPTTHASRVAEVPATRRASVVGPAAHRTTRYTLELSQAATSGGRALPMETIEAEWLAERLDDRLRVRLADIRTSEAHPLADLRRTRMEIGFGADGTRQTIGFDAETTPTQREHLTLLATLFVPSLQDASDWTVEVSDATARFRAAYTRDGDGIERHIERFLAMHTDRGPDRQMAERLSVRGGTRYTLDGDALVRADVHRALHFRPEGGRHHVRVLHQGSLVRVGEATGSALARLVLRPIGPQADLRADARAHDRALLADASVGELIDDLDAVVGENQFDEIVRGQRHRTLRRLTALLRIDPSQTPAIVDALHARRERGPAVAMLAGALAQAGHAEATAGLVELLEAELPAGARRSVTAGLALTDAPTVESLGVLGGQMHTDDGAALAAAAQAGKLMDEAPDEAAEVIDALVARYHDATAVDERRLCVLALANTGDRRALPVMQAEIAHGDTATATYGLRFIPGGDVDALLAAALTADDLIFDAALRAIAHRDAAVWREPLRALRTDVRSDRRATIDATLAILG